MSINTRWTSLYEFLQRDYLLYHDYQNLFGIDSPLYAKATPKGRKTLQKLQPTPMHHSLTALFLGYFYDAYIATKQLQRDHVTEGEAYVLIEKIKKTSKEMINSKFGKISKLLYEEHKPFSNKPRKLIVAEVANVPDAILSFAKRFNASLTLRFDSLPTSKIIISLGTNPLYWSLRHVPPKYKQLHKPWLKP